MSLLDKAKQTAKDVADKASTQADIVKQRVEGEMDKSKGKNVQGEAKVKAAQARDKMNK